MRSTARRRAPRRTRDDARADLQGASQIQANYRVTDRFNVGGNYTWSEAKGNDVGEITGCGPGASLASTYREYKAFAQNNPVGYLPNDQTHKARLWLSYDQPLGIVRQPELQPARALRLGYAVLGVRATSLARVRHEPGLRDSAGDASTYYFSDRGEYRWDDMTATDLALNWELPVKKVERLHSGRAAQRLRRAGADRRQHVASP